MIKRKYPYEDYHKEIGGVLYKRCSICNEWFLCNTEYFYSNKSNKSDGLYPECKQCSVEKSMSWIKDNHEKWLELQRKYDKKPERRKSHKLRIKEQRDSGYQKEYYYKNIEKMKKYADNRAQSKSHEISKEEWECCKTYFSFECAYCGMTEEEHKQLYKQQLHREHAYFNGTNDLSNCVPSCKPCNSTKHEYDYTDWYTPENPNFTQARLDKINIWLREDYKLYLNQNEANQ